MEEQSTEHQLGAVQQTIQFFETLLCALSDGVAITDAAQKIIVANETFCSLFGKSWGEIVETGLPVWLGKMDPGAPQRWADLEKQVRSSGICRDVEFELPVPGPSGNAAGDVRQLSVNASGLKRAGGDDGGVIVSVWRDVTEHKRAEETLRQSEAGLKQAQQLAHVGSWQWNLVDNSFEMSDEMRRIYGLSENDSFDGIHSVVEKVVHPDDREMIAEAMSEVSATHAGQPLAFRLLRPDGEVRWIVAMAPDVRHGGDSDQPTVMVGTVQDITEHKRAEEALRRSKRDLAVGNSIANVFLAVTDEDIYGEVLRIVLDAMASKHGVFGYIDDDGSLVCPSMTRDIWDQCQMSDKTIVFPRETWSGLWGRSLVEKKTLWSNEPLSVPEGHIHVLRALTVPIIHQEKVVGHLMVGNKATDYDEQDRELLERIAGAVAPILDARLQRDKQEKERKVAEEASRIKDRVIASSVNPIVMVDLEGNLTYANESFLETWGYDNESRILGRPGEELWHMGAEVRQALRRNGKWIGRASGRSSDAGPLELQLSATLVRDELGEPLCMAFSFMNVTEISQLRRRLKAEQSFAGIVGRDARMLELFDTIREVAEVTVPVLIQGESGTGKELVAAAIHAEGLRADKPFVPVNCGALPEGILESELFGHVQGAFTGAVRDRKGRFELADGGTIFLDEIGDIPRAMQAKLLRVLQENAFERVGGEETLRVDVRVISATNRDLRREVAEGKFREDLFYRLSVVPLVLPPLRERRSDIPLLADHLLRKALAQTGRQDVTFSQEVIEAIMDYAWPGNVRELENAIQYALVKCRDKVLAAHHLPPAVGRAHGAVRRPAKRRRRGKLSAQAVRRALEETGGNKVQAARRLGVSRATLYRFFDDTGV